MSQKINKIVDIVVKVCYYANIEQPIAQKRRTKGDEKSFTVT
jgi:Trm5-related predicted tRNA methylase